MDRFSIRTIVLIGVAFLAVGYGLSIAAQAAGKFCNPPASYECHFPKVACAPVLNS
jgi:hypothetical protein